MKRITLNTVFSKIKRTLLLGLSLSMLSMSAMAADAPGKPQTDRFNHMTTGFPLTGAHLITECSSCHTDGVFKGTPRDCAGCHTKGRKVIATPKSAKHIPTDEACDVCHSNTVTFLGTRYNHGRVVPGQCTTCHNGHIALGKPASHTTLMKATNSCDACHRTFVWLPASWNHIGAPQNCSTQCHNGTIATGRTASATYPNGVAHAKDGRLSYECSSCHIYFGWYPASYKHADSNYVGTCSTCHDYTSGKNYTPVKANHANTSGMECSDCHSKTAWAGASGAAPSNHSYFVPGATCATCHPTTKTSHITGSALHVYLTGNTCRTCHATNTPGFSNIQTKNHNASKDCNASGCHTSGYTSWNH